MPTTENTILQTAANENYQIADENNLRKAENINFFLFLEHFYSVACISHGSKTIGYKYF